MGLIDTIRTYVVGTDGDRSQGDAAGVDEAEPDATTEAAIKGTDEPASGETGTGGTTTDASRGSPTETPRGSADDAVDAADATASDTDEAASHGDGAGAAAASDLEAVSGIGEVYANRLRTAGVTNVKALVEADATTVAADTGIGEARIERWQERAAAE